MSLPRSQSISSGGEINTRGKNNNIRETTKLPLHTHTHTNIQTTINMHTHPCMLYNIFHNT